MNVCDEFVVHKNRMSLFCTYCRFLNCVIGCADHCVYVGAGTIFLYLGGSGMVGSELC